MKAQLAMLLEMQEESVKQMSTFALLHMQRQNKERENCSPMGGHSSPFMLPLYLYLSKAKTAKPVA